jgi:hypothetical protein
VVAAGRRFSWNFLLANVAFPILGSDFLAFLNLILDFSGGVLFNKKRGWVCKLATPAVAAKFSVVVPVGRFDQEWSDSMPTGAAENNVRETEQVPCVASLSLPRERGGHGSQLTEGKQSIDSLKSSFTDIFSDTARLPAAKHGVTHQIITAGRPVSARYRHLDTLKLAAAKLEFQQLEEAGIIRQPKSQWASPLHMVRKADGSWQPCGTTAASTPVPI